MCQKSISFKNWKLSELCHDCILWQISDIILRKHYHKKLSENCKFLASDTFLTHLCSLTVFWQFFVVIINNLCTKLCQKSVIWYLPDGILTVFKFSKLMIYWHIFYFWYISETFLILVWHILDRILKLTHFWHFSDTFWTDFWQFYVTDSFLTDFRQFSDTFLKLLGPTLSKSTKVRARIIFA